MAAARPEGAAPRPARGRPRGGARGAGAVPRRRPRRRRPRGGRRSGHRLPPRRAAQHPAGVHPRAGRGGPPGGEPPGFRFARLLTIEAPGSLTPARRPELGGGRERRRRFTGQEPTGPSPARSGGTRRHSGEPFITHPLAVAAILADLGVDTTTLVAALLHDTVEDTAYTLELAREEFGEEVAHLVDGVTKLDKLRFGEAAEAETIRKMILAMARDLRVLVIKLADRVHNMRTLGFQPPHKQERIARATLDVLVPLADRLGIQVFKRELEDLAFVTLEPAAYEATTLLFRERAAQVEAYLREVIGEVEPALREAGVKATMSARPKHLFSVHHSVQERGGGTTDFYDVARLLIEEGRRLAGFGRQLDAGVVDVGDAVAVGGAVVAVHGGPHRPGNISASMVRRRAFPGPRPVRSTGSRRFRWPPLTQHLRLCLRVDAADDLGVLLVLVGGFHGLQDVGVGAGGPGLRAASGWPAGEAERLRADWGLDRVQVRDLRDRPGRGRRPAERAHQHGDAEQDEQAGPQPAGVVEDIEPPDHDEDPGAGEQQSEDEGDRVEVVTLQGIAGAHCGSPTVRW